MDTRPATPRHRFYPFFSGEYTGAVFGRVSFLVFNRELSTFKLSVSRIAMKYHANPRAIEKAIRMLVEGGYIERVKRSTYRMTPTGEATARFTPCRLYDPYLVSKSMTPRLAAVLAALVDFKNQTVAARQFFVTRRTWYRLRDRAVQALEIRPDATLSGKGYPQSETRPDVTRTRPDVTRVKLGEGKATTRRTRTSEGRTDENHAARVREQAYEIRRKGKP